MKKINFALLVILALSLSGCVLVRSEEWGKLQQDISDLKKDAEDAKKTKEALKTQIQEMEKSTVSQLSARIMTVENSISSLDKELRKKQADIVADMSSIRSDFQVLTGRFEETKYAVQKGLQEEKVVKEEADRWRKDIYQTLEEIQKRISALEQSLILLRQERETGKEKSTEAPSIEDAYKDAYETYQKGDYPAAREKFQRYLDAFPNSKYSENAIYWIGESYYSEKNYERAIVEFDDVVKKYPDGAKAPAALLKQGMAFSSLGDKKSANAIFKKVTEKYPKSEQADAARKKLKE